LLQEDCSQAQRQFHAQALAAQRKEAKKAFKVNNPSNSLRAFFAPPVPVREILSFYLLLCAERDFGNGGVFIINRAAICFLYHEAYKARAYAARVKALLLHLVWKSVAARSAVGEVEGRCGQTVVLFPDGSVFEIAWSEPHLIELNFAFKVTLNPFSEPRPARAFNPCCLHISIKGVRGVVSKSF